MTIIRIYPTAFPNQNSSFLLLNPNGCIPAIIDHTAAWNDFRGFESGAIFLYLAELYGKDFKVCFEDADEKSEMIQWLFFWNAGLGDDGGRHYLVGKNGRKYSVADGLFHIEFPKLERMKRIEEGPAVQEGLLVPSGEDQIENLRKDPNVEEPFKGWVMKGQEEVRETHGD
ncbi:hypothetical protein K469DRAFT_725068 [Zopfia rhizophila CBS 207.26]|uniref:GST N-terminal domain-containing protein n=1 Tax=Zopfia rhizophila CBS 207.26 TaxID=1314779 RepID=A0A6A6EB92_9PEZI|nr:hypothetical protein K469DRAFT_725068 [Zopfia rhizophila CBS 207.26]